MEDSHIENITNGIAIASSPLEFRIDYENYLNQRKLTSGRRFLFDYNESTIGFTLKQIKVLKLVSKGYANAKIAQCLGVRESAVKLLIYRMMKYLEEELSEDVDRFYLVIIAQQLGLEDYES